MNEQDRETPKSFRKNDSPKCHPPAVSEPSDVEDILREVYELLEANADYCRLST